MQSADSTDGTDIESSTTTQPLDTEATAATPVAATEDDLEKKNRRFTQWRKVRPFFAGLFTILAGVVMLIPAYLSFEVSNIIIQVSTLSGVSTALIGALMITSGLMMWVKPDTRLLAGVAAIVLGIVALPMSNLGAFGIGTLLSVIGGSLALAWTERDRTPKEKKRKRKKSAAAVTAALASTSLAAAVLTEPAPEAEAQLNLPGMPNLQLPEAPQPPAAPKLPDTIELPKVPPLEVPKIEPPKLPEVPENLQMDLNPPGPIDGLRPLQDGTFTIQTDSTRLLGNLKLSLVQQDTPSGPQPAIRIDADKAVLDNLRVQFPGNATNGGVDTWQRSGPGQITTLTGNFHIVVSSLTVTPQVAGATLFPITIEASMAPEQLQKELAKMGLGQPDALAEQLVMLNGTMNTFFVKSDELEAGGGTTIGA